MFNTIIVSKEALLELSKQTLLELSKQASDEIEEDPDPEKYYAYYDRISDEYPDAEI